MVENKTVKKNNPKNRIIFLSSKWKSVFLKEIKPNNIIKRVDKLMTGFPNTKVNGYIKVKIFKILIDNL